MARRVVFVRIIRLYSLRGDIVFFEGHKPFFFYFFFFLFATLITYILGYKERMSQEVFLKCF